ncbi:unnamed protein product [Bemisia tabaci]|uniref:EF-hand domain-containing protein n=1 Tax=Bemisia tabaci TaxID=7038 RepID=A0A9P0AF21_BEMTA|nr:PREDICTED: multiple coagulation factor deficiency protein 2-like isoform X2 [Bemisia tabaci]CAH0390362.1 unnamed protein product [Bemisia tabaci]
MNSMSVNFLVVSLHTLSTVVFVVCHQAIPPGVNPKTYQQPQQFHQQQVPVAQQQYMQPQAQVQPQQFVHEQVPVQPIHQAPPPSGHIPQQHFPHEQHLLDAKNIQHEKDHIADHLEVPIDTSKMSEQELQFHYFKMNDADNNDKLDGCELIKSLIHWHGEEKDKDKTTDSKDDSKLYSDAELVEMIEPVLLEYDKNLDGLISWAEFKAVEHS